jgi:chorismate mutase
VKQKFTAFLFLEKRKEKMKLEDWRTEIDEIDAEIVSLLIRRARIAKKIGVLKAKAGLPIVDAQREDEILRRILKNNGPVLPDEAMIRIYRKILHESRQIQIETWVRIMRKGEMAR